MLRVQKNIKTSFWKARLREISKRRKSDHDKLLKDIHLQYKRWQRTVVKSALKRMPERDKQFKNQSGIKVKRFYTPLDANHNNFLLHIGFPGSYPFTAGVYPTMYRSRMWTMRMFSGYGTPEDTNKRLKYLLDHGESGLSIAFDMPTLYGYDCDHPKASGEVGRCGVNVSSLKDMELIFNGIPLDRVSTSMTINAPASVLTCMYIATAERQGVQMSKLRGTVQADILKEYIAQKEWVFPPEDHLRIIRDMMLYCTKNMPQWNYISISGYHIHEAGASALQELAFTLADGFSYIDLGMESGLSVDEFAPRLSFFFNCGMDFFEEIAKFRAARRIWARVMKEKYKAKNPRSLMLRVHSQTSGASLTWQQPLNNVVRTTIEALAAVLGGTQSLHTNSYDEAYALPSEEAVTLALRTQQIIAEETGVVNVADPLVGSYYVEWLTDQMEENAYRYFDKIESLGGMLEAIKTGYIQSEIANTSYRYQREIESKQRVIVGVNKYEKKERSPISVLRIDPAVQRKQIGSLQKLRHERDRAKVTQALEELRRAFQDPNANCIYPILEAVKTYATLGEIMDVGREVFGEWSESKISGLH